MTVVTSFILNVCCSSLSYIIAYVKSPPLKRRKSCIEIFYPYGFFLVHPFSEILSLLGKKKDISSSEKSWDDY